MFRSGSASSCCHRIGGGATSPALTCSAKSSHSPSLMRCLRLSPTSYTDTAADTSPASVARAGSVTKSLRPCMSHSYLEGTGAARHLVGGARRITGPAQPVREHPVQRHAKAVDKGVAGAWVVAVDAPPLGACSQRLASFHLSEVADMRGEGAGQRRSP